MREREGQTERDRQRQTDRERETERVTDRERERELCVKSTIHMHTFNTFICTSTYIHVHMHRCT